MKITLNSHPAFIPEALKNANCGFGLYCASNDLGKTHFSFIQKLVEKSNNILKKHNLLRTQDEDINFIEQTLNNIQYTKIKFPSIIENLNFQLNIDTNLNKALETFSTMSYLVSYNRTYMANMFSPFDNALYGHKDNETVVIGSKIEGVFFKSLNASLTDKKRLDFVFFHELGHYIESHHEKETGSYMHNLIETIGDINVLSSSTFLRKNNEYSDIERGMLTSLYRLPREIYADTASLLLIRNRDIENGTFNKQDCLDNVTHLQNARVRENFVDLRTEDIQEILPYFTHKTSIAMDLVYNKINQMEDKPLNLEELNTICCEVKEEAMARTFYTILKSHSMFRKQMLPITATEFDGNKYFVNKEKMEEKFDEFQSNIKSLIGKEWIDDFEAKVTKAQPSKHLHYVRLIFNLGFNEINTGGQMNIVSANKDVDVDVNLNIKNIRDKNIKTFKIENKIKS